MMHPHPSEALVIHWLESTSRSIEASFPTLRRTPSSSRRVSERLSALLLERLSPGVALSLLELLPDAPRAELGNLRDSALREQDPSIGYPAFVERTLQIIGCETPPGATPLNERACAEFCRSVADAFLWAVLQEVPAELKARIGGEVPAELRSRLNLYSSVPHDAKVA